MAKSGSIKSLTGGKSGAATAYFDFRWSSESAGTGKTKVTWELWRCGRHSSPKRYAHGYTINISYKTAEGTTKTEELEKDYDFVDNDTYTFDDEKTAAKARTGSFIVQHASDGTGTFTVKFSDIRIYTNSNIGSTTHSISLETNYPYTACTAPTTVTVVENSGSGNRVKPGGVIKISWSGAKPGTANAIVGYQVQYKIGSGNWIEVASKATGSSILATISSNSTRGASIIAQVKTLGTQSGYNSSFKASSDACKVNLLPNKPSVTVNKNIFSSTSGDHLIIKATAGNSNDSDQTTQIAYRVGGTGSKIQLTNKKEYNFDKEPSAGTYLYEFWTYDGLEYSSSESFYVRKNASKPNVANLTIDGTALVSQNNESGYNYIVSPSISWTKGEGGWTNASNSNNSYRVGIQYNLNDNLKNGAKVLVQQNLSTALSYKIPDVRLYIPMENNQGYYYRVYVERYDGIEWGATYSDKIYYVTRVPKVIKISNDKGKVPTNKDTEFHQYFSKRLGVYLEYDQGYNQIDFIAKDSSGTIRVGPISIPLTKLQEEEKTYLGCAITEASLGAWPRGSQYDIYIAPKYVVGGKENFAFSYIKYTQSVGISTRTRTKALPTNFNLQWGTSGSVIKPFTSEDQSPTFYGIHNKTTTWYWEYGFQALPAFTLSIKYGGKTKTKTGTYKYEVSEVGNTGEITVPGADIYDLFINSGFFNTKSLSNYTVAVELKTVNVFSEQYSGSINKLVSFAEDFYVINAQLYIKSSTDDKFPFFGGSASEQLLKEGMGVYLSAQVKSYHGVPNGLRAQLYSDKGLVFDGARGSESFSTESGSAKVSHGHPVTYTFDSKIGTISQIIEQQFLKKIDIICADARSQRKTATYRGTNVPASIFRRHEIGRGSIAEGSYNESKMNIKLSFSDFGLDDAINSSPEAYDYKMTFYYINKENILEKEELFNDTIKPTDFKYEITVGEIGSFSQVYVTLQTSYTIKGITTTYTTRTPELVIYNSRPTVCYRKNQIGINYDPTAKPTGNVQKACLVVGAYNEKTKIVFDSAGIERTIGLDTGKISSFVIDCGSWN